MADNNKSNLDKTALGLKKAELEGKMKNPQVEQDVVSPYAIIAVTIGMALGGLAGRVGAQIHDWATKNPDKRPVWKKWRQPNGEINMKHMMSALMGGFLGITAGHLYSVYTARKKLAENYKTEAESIDKLIYEANQEDKRKSDRYAEGGVTNFTHEGKVSQGKQEGKSVT